MRHRVRSQRSRLVDVNGKYFLSANYPERDFMNLRFAREGIEDLKHAGAVSVPEFVSVFSLCFASLKIHLLLEKITSSCAENWTNLVKIITHF